MTRVVGQPSARGEGDCGRDGAVKSPVPSAPASHSDPWPPARQAWTVVIVLLLLYVVSLLDRNIIALLAEPIREDLDLSDLRLSLLLGPAFAVSYAVGALPLGWAMDRYSRRFVVWCGVTVWSIASVASGLSRNFWQLFVSRSFVGAGESVLVPGSQSILADMFPPERLALPISIYSLGSKIGQGLSFFIGGLLTAAIIPAASYAVPFLGEIRGWQAIFIIVGLPGVLLALLVYLFPEPPRRRRLESGAGSPTGYGDYLRYAKRNARFLVSIHVAGVITTMVVAALAAWTPVYFMRTYHWPVDQVGLWLGVVIVAGPVTGLPLHGWIADRLFRRGVRDAHTRYLVWMILAAAGPLVGAYLVGNPWLSLALLCLGQAAIAAYVGLMPTALQLMVTGDLRGKAASVLLLATSLGGVSVGPMVVAAVSDWLMDDPEQIGRALAICVGFSLPVAALFYGMTLKPLRRAYG